MSGTDPRVGIVLRTKDRPVLLARALADIAAQSFSGWTLCVVNDGGEQEPFETAMAPALRRHGDRITVIRHPSPVGMEGSSNEAIAALATEFVVVHDDDDTWSPDFLARTVDHLDTHPSADGVTVRTTIIWERLEGWRLVETGREVFLPEQREVALTALLDFNRFVPISFLFRRSLLERVGQFDGGMAVLGDWDFHLRALPTSRIDYLDEEGLAFWHQRPGDDSAAGNTVISRRAEHDAADEMLRDRRLREWTAEHGPGLPLYLAWLSRRARREQDERAAEIRRRLDEIDARLDRLIDRVDAVAERGLIPLARRKYWALRARARRPV